MLAIAVADLDNAIKARARCGIFKSPAGATARRPEMARQRHPDRAEREDNQDTQHQPWSGTVSPIPESFRENRAQGYEIARLRKTE